jgi:hypothetical protein
LPPRAHRKEELSFFQEEVVGEDSVIFENEAVASEEGVFQSIEFEGH